MERGKDRQIVYSLAARLNTTERENVPVRLKQKGDKKTGRSEHRVPRSSCLSV
jgi:hypothetical protein